MDSALTPALRRRLGLPLLFLYGVGITVGAGIYVLIGAVAGHAGTAAPWAFALAAAAMALTVGSYAELSTRFPVSAGEAAYVRAALNSRLASTAIGLLTMVIGIVASATVALGSAGYIGQFVAWPTPLIVAGVLIGLGLIAAGVASGVSLAPVLAPPPLEAHALAGIGYAALLAFFAFIGFEDLANVVEEAKVPHRDIPRAMVLTLIVTTV